MSKSWQKCCKSQDLFWGSLHTPRQLLWQKWFVLLASHLYHRFAKQRTLYRALLPDLFILIFSIHFLERIAIFCLMFLGTSVRCTSLESLYTTPCCALLCNQTFWNLVRPDPAQFSSDHLSTQELWCTPWHISGMGVHHSDKYPEIVIPRITCFCLVHSEFQRYMTCLVQW